MKRYIILHHTAYQSEKPQFEEINRWHRFREFQKSSLGWYVGYQYVIERDGAARQARAEEEVGAHTLSTNPNYPNLNEAGIGICLAGDFTKENPTEAQIAALFGLVRGVQARHRIPDTNILLHREVKQTTCPGVDLREMMLARTQEDLRRQLKIAELALPRVRATRKPMLTRLIARLRALLVGVD